MKLFTTKQIAELDKYTIENEPISDIDLMERASIQITNWLVQNFTTEQKLVFFAGPGNNGGDALAIARQMAELDYSTEVYLLDFKKELKGSLATNWERLEKQGKVKLSKISSIADFPELIDVDVIIDGMFGSGLTRPLEGMPAEIVNGINVLNDSREMTSQICVVAIDIPSGLMGEDNSVGRHPTQSRVMTYNNIVKADYTLTFQFPKVSFLFAENMEYVGCWEVLPIGLHADGIKKIESPCTFIEKSEIQERMPVRSKFDHKGTLGHALLIAGSYGKMGAVVLASKACLRAGVGLLTSHVPHMGYSIIQTAVPEAMVSVDRHDSIFTEFPELKPFSAIGIGPGLDKKANSQKALLELLEKSTVPLVIDADALNILAQNKDWLNKLPKGSILTPHPGEFKRLVGECENSFQCVQKQLEFSRKYDCVVVLKGANTSVSTPDGKLFFNSTGNPGMATAGSGDVLTGIILGLLAQGMSAEDAALIGAYLHGLAGDLAANEKSEFALVAGDIVEFLGKAFLCFLE